MSALVGASSRPRPNALYDRILRHHVGPERASEPEVVDWGVGRAPPTTAPRIVRALPGLGLRRAILSGSLSRGGVGGQSDLDLIFYLRHTGAIPRALSPLL